MDPVGERLLAFLGLLGAIGFAALVLVLQSPEKFTNEGLGLGPGYVAIILVVLSEAILFTIFGSVAWALEASHRRPNRRRFATVLTTLAFAGVVTVITLMIVPFNLVAGIVVGASALVLLMLTVALSTNAAAPPR